MRPALLILSTLFLLTGCNDKSGDTIVWDFINPSVEFEVTDADGHDLLDPEYDGNILGDGISVNYKDQTYEIEEGYIESRALLPRELALRLEKYAQYSRYILAFGEFSPTNNYRGESFTIDWGNGKPPVSVKFDIFVKRHGNKPKVTRNLWYDGQKKESFRIIIVK